MKDYKINEKGIYYTENSYHDEVDINYVVDIGAPEAKAQLERFIRNIMHEGAEQRTKEIGQLLGVRR